MPKTLYEVEIAGTVYEVEADSPEQAEREARDFAGPMGKATAGMQPNSTMDEQRPLTSLYEQMGGDPEGVVPRVLAGAGKRIGETVTGTVEGLVDAAKTAYTQPGAFASAYPEALARLPAMFAEGLKETAGNAMSLDPERMGSAGVDIAAMAAGAKGPATRAGGAAARATGRTLRRPGVSAVMDAAGSHGGVFGFLKGLREQAAEYLDPPRLVRREDPVYGPRTTFEGGAKVEPSPAAAAVRDRYIRPNEALRGPSAAGSPMAPLREAVVEAEPAPITPQKSIHERRYIPSTPPARATGAGPRVGGMGGVGGGSMRGPSVAEAEAAMGAAGGNIETLFKQLSSKPVLTPVEQAQLAQLREILRQQASNRGMGYAAR